MRVVRAALLSGAGERLRDLKQYTSIPSGRSRVSVSYRSHRGREKSGSYGKLFMF